MKKTFIFSLMLFVIFLVLPVVINHPYYRHVLIMMMIWATLGVAWNILGGFTGQVSFGHAAFFGVGAYTAGLGNVHLGLSPWWGMLFGPIFAALIALPIGALTFRLRGPYFALGTLALGEIFYIVFSNWKSFTKGAQGILIMPQFTDKLPYYYLALGMLITAIVISFLTVHSKAGYYMVAIREDQDSAEALGISTARYKMLALLLSAFITGMAGAFYMNYVNFIDPAIVFSLSDVSVMIILVVMMGGVATIFGPVVGAAVYIGLNELLRAQLGSANALVFGILVVFIILFMPNGLVGEILMRFRKNVQGKKRGEVSGTFGS
ncbi:MAG: branched-chain amino acid ABC transporter permease [Candidatus Carbobacillus sp.]|nr:branched-chain amino acid ABC transporter permease [Candidatus Carbobacillus sp.]